MESDNTRKDKQQKLYYIRKMNQQDNHGKL